MDREHHELSGTIDPRSHGRRVCPRTPGKAVLARVPVLGTRCTTRDADEKQTMSIVDLPAQIERISDNVAASPDMSMKRISPPRARGPATNARVAGLVW